MGIKLTDKGRTTALEAFLVDLSHFETFTLKHELVDSMNLKELTIYDSQVREIGSVF
jgi:hypothetical protein